MGDMVWRFAAGLVLVLAPACSYHAPGATPGDGPSAGSDSGTDTPDNDGDSDGIADDVDNCPAIANADQHDEDRDDVGDACDPCPQVPNATADSDGDGIADACDPHPMMSGDELVVFEPFTGTGNLPAGWTLKGAGNANDYVIDNDVLTLTTGDTHILIRDTGATHHAIDTAFDVLASANGNNGLQFVTVLADALSDIKQFVGCGIRFDNQPPAPDRELFVLDNPNLTSLSTDLTDPPVATGSYRMRLVMDEQMQRCLIPSNGNPHLQTGSTPSQGNTFVGLRANNLTLAFRYVAIYKF